MKRVFVDTSHFVAIIHKRDQFHESALGAEKELGAVRKVTSEFVLIEVLNYFSDFRSDVKEYAFSSVERVLSDNSYEIVLCSSELFKLGYELYSNRLDKGYSLTDCTSMHIMTERGVTEILTNDEHFEQEGFRVLL